MATAENKRIVKNTSVLYVRMLLSVIVNLYTVKLLWQVLGIDNYGIYNVVGGVVMMFAFLNNAMIASSQRFLSFELGRGDEISLNKTFNASVIIHLLIAAAVLVILESVGLWFLNYRLNIPKASIEAANWVYQCSIFTFILTIISVPYNASIVAHEHINIYGYFGIIDIFAKLGIVVLIEYLPFNRLKAYAVGIMCLALVMRIVYGLYCTKHFKECRIKHYQNRKLIKEMLSFGGWSFLGNMGIAIRDQGINIILNLFYGVVINAAKGIATQISGVINGFTSSFTMAINPQITKRYAANDRESMMSLICAGCKYTLLLMAMIIIPVIISAEQLMIMWLGKIAPYTIIFLDLILGMSLLESVVSPITTGLLATGRIKKFQIYISFILLLNLPISWYILKLGFPPYSAIIVNIVLSFIGLTTRLLLLREQIKFSILNFIKKVYGRTIPSIMIYSAICYLTYHFIEKNLTGLIFYGIISLLIFIISTYIIALSKKERGNLISMLRHKTHT